MNSMIDTTAATTPLSCRHSREELTPEYFNRRLDDFVFEMCAGARTEGDAARRLLRGVESEALASAIAGALLPSLPPEQSDARNLSDLRAHCAKADTVAALGAAVTDSPALARFLFASLLQARCAATLREWDAWDTTNGEDNLLDWNDPATAREFRRRFALMLQADKWDRQDWEKSGLSVDDLLVNVEGEDDEPDEQQQANEVEAPTQ
jgi:hypothetical protein